MHELDPILRDRDVTRTSPVSAALPGGASSKSTSSLSLYGSRCTALGGVLLTLLAGLARVLLEASVSPILGATLYHETHSKMESTWI